MFGQSAGSTLHGSLMERRTELLRVALVLLVYLVLLVGSGWRVSPQIVATLPVATLYLAVSYLGYSNRDGRPLLVFLLCLLEGMLASAAYLESPAFGVLLFLTAASSGARLPLLRGTAVVTATWLGYSLDRLLAPEPTPYLLTSLGASWVLLFAIALVAHSLVEGERHQHRQAVQATVLHTIGRETSRSLVLGDILRSLVGGLTNVYQDACCCVYLLEEGELVPKEWAGPYQEQPTALPAESPSLVTRAVREAKTLHQADARLDAALGAARPVGYRPLRAVVSPLLGQHRVLGAIAVALGSDRDFSQDDRQLLETIAAQAAAALANCMLYQEALNRTRTLERFYSFSQALDQVHSAKGVVAVTTDHALKMVSGHTCLGLLPDLDGDHFYCAGGVGKLAQAHQGLVLRAEHRVLAEALRTGKPIEGEAEELELGLDTPCHCCLLPLVNERMPVGILLLLRESSLACSESECHLLFTLGRQAAVSLQSAQLYEEARARAITDGLTGLYNHRHFHERLREELVRAARYQLCLSVIMLDVDDFKALNDTEGHPRGDAVLQAVARLLRSFARSTDVVARYGGDEFTIVVLEAGQEQAAALAERIRSAVRRVTIVDERSLSRRLTVSQGIATYPDHAESPPRLIELADQALAKAKRLGKDTVVVARARRGVPV